MATTSTTSPHPNPLPVGEGATIEWIVREVIRRLRQVNADVAGGGADQAAPAIGELNIEDRVVTLETLHNRLDGIQSVVVQRKAIVTPAVRDELKDRGVALRQATGSGAATTLAKNIQQDRRPTVWCVADGIDVDALQQMCGNNIAVKTSSNSDAAIEPLTGTDVAVVITNAPSAVVVSANRNPNIRAAVGFNFPAVRQAIDEANANLLAIDPRGKGTTELFGMINEFLSRN